MCAPCRKHEVWLCVGVQFPEKRRPRGKSTSLTGGHWAVSQVQRDHVWSTRSPFPSLRRCRPVRLWTENGDFCHVCITTAVILKMQSCNSTKIILHFFFFSRDAL